MEGNDDFPGHRLEIAEVNVFLEEKRAGVSADEEVVAVGLEFPFADAAGSVGGKVVRRVEEVVDSVDVKEDASGFEGAVEVFSTGEPGEVTVFAPEVFKERGEGFAFVPEDECGEAPDLVWVSGDFGGVKQEWAEDFPPAAVGVEVLVALFASADQQPDYVAEGEHGFKAVSTGWNRLAVAGDVKPFLGQAGQQRIAGPEDSFAVSVLQAAFAKIAGCEGMEEFGESAEMDLNWELRMLDLLAELIAGDAAGCVAALIIGIEANAVFAAGAETTGGAARPVQRGAASFRISVCVDVLCQQGGFAAL